MSSGTVRKVWLEAKEPIAVVAMVVLYLVQHFAPETLPKWFPNAEVLLASALLFCLLSFIAAISTNIQTRRLVSGAAVKLFTLSAALNDLIPNKRFDNVLIYAVSSRNIQALLRSNRCRIDSCKVLLWKPVGDDNPYLAFDGEIEQVIKSGWKAKGMKELVKETEIRRYRDMPDVYFVILDREYAVLGFYRRNGEPNTAVDFSNVMIYNYSVQAEAKVIDWLITQHQAMWGEAADAVKF
jgi:hypothetical protein